jgi:Tol biopolymer transport system component
MKNVLCFPWIDWGDTLLIKPNDIVKTGVKKGPKGERAVSILDNWSRDAICFVPAICLLVTLSCCSAPPAAPSHAGQKWGLAAEYDNVVLLSAIGGSSERPAWSPDGTRLAFQHTETRTGVADDLANRDIYVMRVDTGEYSRVTRAVESGNSCEGPSWAPDGSSLVFACNFDGDYDLYTANIFSAVLSQLTNHPGDEWNPSWSPDGTRIAFSLIVESEGSGTGQYRQYIYTVACDDAELRELQEVGYDATPTWSPDSEELGFTYQKTNTSAPQLCIMAADGSSLLCNDHIQCSNSAWSPNGDRIACLTLSEILVLHRNNNKATILLDVGYRSLSGLSWSPDGDQLVFTAGSAYGVANDLYLLELEK